MPIRKRLDIKGPAMAFITTSVQKWMPVLAESMLAMTVLEQLRETMAHFQVAVVAYVIMPSHVHLLLGFRKVEKMSEIIQAFKRLSSKKLKALMSEELKSNFQFSSRFSFWQDRFDDVIVWSQKQFKVKIEYIHNNPVKANLVSTATDFEFSSARDWLSGEEGKIPISKSWDWLKEN
jgi:putative transposase